MWPARGAGGVKDVEKVEDNGSVELVSPDAGSSLRGNIEDRVAKQADLDDRCLGHASE